MAAAEDKGDKGTTGTDQFDTYQDKAGKTAADKGKDDKKNLSSNPDKDPLKPVTFDHGEESEQGKKDREALEALQNDPSSGLVAQQHPDNQDPSVLPKK